MRANKACVVAVCVVTSLVAGCHRKRARRNYDAPTVGSMLTVLQGLQGRAYSFRAETVMDYWLGDDRQKGTVKIMAKRGKKIEESLDEAEKTKQEAIAKRAESDSIVTDARRQAADIVLEARKDAESERARIIEAAHKEAEEIIAKAHTTVEDERKSIYAGAASSIADLSVAVATKIVGEALEDETEQKKLIERYIQEAGSLNAD